MANDIPITWWMWCSLSLIGILLLVSFVLKLYELGVIKQKKPLRLQRRSWIETFLLLVFVGGIVQYGGTKSTNRNHGGSSSMKITTGQDAGYDVSGRASGGINSVVESSSLHFANISVSSNGVLLEVAWPTNMFANGTSLDFFVSVGSLTNEWQWAGVKDVLPGETNLFYVIEGDEFGSGTNMVSSMFFYVSDRYSCACTMRDSDFDGVPDVYELYNGTNPYVQDSSLVPRITVGEFGQYTDIQDALKASTNYSIISCANEMFALSTPLIMPSHPVILEGSQGGYAILRSTARIGAVMLTQGQTTETVFRNLILDLRASDGFQAGFWVGGNLPWSGTGAGATFDNVRIRAPYPKVEYFGWLFYRDDAGGSYITNCTMNAAGATWAYGLSSYNGASNIIQNTSFLNMPTNAGELTAIAMMERFSGNTIIRRTEPIVVPGLSWAGYPYDAMYSSYDDSDGDGISDYDEIHHYNTDPWLEDSDADGVSDYDEVQSGTDPTDIYSYNIRIAVSLTNTVAVSSVTNYIFIGDVENWKANLLVKSDDCFVTTNADFNMVITNASVGVFSDLNRNGEYDDNDDVLVIKSDNGVGNGYAIKYFNFVMGDIDGDRVSDLQERTDGSDPYDSDSFKLKASIRISIDDSVQYVTNYITVSMVEASTNYIFSSASVSSAINISLNDVVSDGCFYLCCVRDFNKNGVRDDLDLVYTWEIRASSNATINYKIYDCDNDGVSDSVEVQEGTDGMDARNYCYSANVRVSGIFSTSNSLKAVAMFGTNFVQTAQLITNDVQDFILSDCSTDSRERHAILFWDDYNNDNCVDENEPSTRVVVVPSGHVTTYRTRLSYGGFDADNDGLLDFWKNITGLAGIEGDHGASVDSDGDGLVNLHEYWAGTDPLVPDGSNTVLSILARSVDDRLKRVLEPELALPIYSNFYENASNGVFVLNPSRWVKDLDLSCVSIWNNSAMPQSHGGTVISKRHILFAQHWRLAKGCRIYFRGTNEVVCSRYVDKVVHVTGGRLPESDICVASLTEDLPDSVVPVSILSPHSYEEINIGKYLPVLVITQDKEALVHTLTKISYPDDPSCRVHFTMPYDSLRQNFYKTVRSGDSGSPTFLIYRNKLILLGTHWYVGIDSSFAMAVEEIQNAMDVIAPGYNLSLIDLRNPLNDGGE